MICKSKINISLIIKFDPANITDVVLKKMLKMIYLQTIIYRSVYVVWNCFSKFSYISGNLIIF